MRSVYVVLSGMMCNNFFGAYATLLQARKELQEWLTNNPKVKYFGDVGDYTYHIVLSNGEETWASIVSDTIEDA